MGTTWQGLLAPLGVSTGDGRRFLAEGFTTRELPVALKWQRTDSMGHDDSVVIGSTTQVNIGTTAEAVKNSWITQEAADTAGLEADTLGVWGSGELFDDIDCQKMGRLCEDVAESKLLTGKKVIGPSVDPGGASAVLVEVGSDEPLTEERLEELWWQSMESGEEMPVEVLFVEYQMAAATLVTVPAFERCRPFILDEQPAVVTAAVRASGWSDLPLADRDHAWDGDAAAGRLADMCGLDGDSPDWGCYAAGFLYHDENADAETRGAYGFGIVDVIDGESRIVANAVYAVASVLEGGRGGTDIPEADQDRMREVVSGLYARMAQEFDDDSIRAPWDGEDSDDAGEQAAAETAALVAALTAAAPSFDPALFENPNLTEITALTVEDLGNGVRRVYGHLATHSTCHVGIREVCTTAPFSTTDYAVFHRYLQTASGIALPTAVGRLTAGHGQFTGTCKCCPGNDDHACSRLSFGGAVAHHDRLRTLAYIRVGEDEANDAVWFSGIIDPDADERDLAALSRRKVSGDWREHAGNLELTELLVLSREQPGFPLPRATARSGRQTALTAAGAVRPPRAVPTDPTQRQFDMINFADVVADLVVRRLQDSTAGSTEVLAGIGAVGQTTAATAALAEQAAGLVDQVNQVTTDAEADHRAAQAARLLEEINV